MMDNLTKAHEGFAPGGAAWLKSRRDEARARVAALGFPTVRQEEWRFTNIAPLLDLPLYVAASNGRAVSAADVAPLLIEGAQALVFVDGVFRADLSAAGEGLGNLQAADGGVVEEHLARHAKFDDQFFAALNTAYFADGAFVHLRANASAPRPVQLLFVAAADKAGAIVHARNLVIAEEGSELKLIETYASLTSQPYVTNTVTEVVLGPNAKVEHCLLQNQNAGAFHIATVQAVQSRDSRWTSHSIATGGQLARNQIQTLLDEEGAEAILNGLYLGSRDQLIDHHTVVDHSAPHCESHEFYHGILTDRSHGVFNGKIFVRQRAQKTNAKQTNRNLVLSENAVIDTKPQLEIFADDVKCTHGATVGQLNEDAMFYLRSRGIGASEARRMLIRAFAADVVERISIEPVRDQLERLLGERFQQVEA